MLCRVGRNRAMAMSEFVSQITRDVRKYLFTINRITMQNEQQPPQNEQIIIKVSGEMHEITVEPAHLC